MIHRAFAALLLALGLFTAAAALASTRLLDALLYEVDALDPVVVVAMSFTLIGIGMLASYVPARRASHVDATVALRND